MSNVQWTREVDRYQLKNEDNTLVDLSMPISGQAVFTMGSKTYQVIKKGFWNPVYHLIQDSQLILKLTHSFWGSNGRIAFEDGAVYTNHYKTKDGLKMVIMEQDNEVLSYSIAFQKKERKTAFHFGSSIIDAEKILILAALGMVVFSSFFREAYPDDDSFLTTFLITAGA
jgi:hypothetical protein